MKLLQLTIGVEGMQCDACAKNVHDALMKIENIDSVEVRLNYKDAVIKYKDKIDVEKVKNTVDELGYRYYKTDS